VPISFRRSRAAAIRHRLAEIRGRILDAVYSPVISRLSVDDYFACRTRNDCLRAFLRARLAG
jgi:hypothetical protein